MTTVIQRTASASGTVGPESVVSSVQVGPVNGQQVSGDNGSEQAQEQVQEQAQEQLAPEPKTMDVAINNVVCSFSTKCHLNLKRIAMEGSNVEYHREHGVR